MSECPSDIMELVEHGQGRTHVGLHPVIDASALGSTKPLFEPGLGRFSNIDSLKIAS